MAEDCHKYEDKLSAYLDGQLDEPQTVDLEEHLRTCDACRRLLEKMRNLSRVGSQGMGNFDKAILNELESRILSGIDAGGEGKTERKGDKPKIIPIWYRYVAVAASAIFIFMIGKMAFDVSISRQSEPKQQTRQHEKSVPADLKMEPSSTEDREAGRYDALKPYNEAKQAEDRPIQKVPEAPVSSPEPVPDEGADASMLEGPSSIMELRERSEEKISPESESTIDARGQPERETDELPVNQAQEVRSARSSLHKQDLIGKKPKSLADDKTDTEKKGLAADQPEELSDSGIIGHTYPELAAPTEAANQREENVQKEPPYVRSLREKMATNDNTLEYHYATRFMAIWDSQDLTGGAGSSRDKNDMLDTAVRKVYNETMPKLKIDNAMLRTLNLYVAARAAYDLYRFTGDKSFLTEASGYREEALDVVYREDFKGNRSRFVEEYRKELENWEF